MVPVDFTWKENHCLNARFPLWTFRMLNITLPTFSFYHTSMSAAGLCSDGNVSAYQELESLVLREKAVVWADQEPQQLNGVGTEEAAREKEAGGGGEMAPILSFSHLHYHTSSPCSKSSVPTCCW